MLTDRRLCAAAGRSLVETVALAGEGGARAVVLREKDLPRARRLELGRAIAGLLAPVGGMLIIASDAALAEELGSHWVHLAVADPSAPPPVGRAPLRFGRSCHDEAEIRAAMAEGAGYVTLSPLLATPSKPGHGPALGFAGLRSLAGLAGAPPVYALGGIRAAHAGPCREAGAHGVAVMGGIMAAPRPREATATLVDAVERAPRRLA